MKILFLNLMHFVLGGQERIVLEELKMLQQHGHQVAVIAMDHPQTLKDDIPKYLLDPDIIDHLKQDGKTASIATKLQYFVSGLHNISAARFMQKVIRDFKPDIIHSHSYNRYFTPSVYEVACNNNIPIVTTEHDHKLTCPAYFFLKGWETYCQEELCLNGNYLHCVTNKCFEKSFLKSSYYALELFINRPRYLKTIQKIMTPSQYLYDVLVRSGIPKHQLQVLRNFVDTRDIKPHYSPGTYYVFCGRLSHEKGIFTLLKCFQEVPHLTLKIIGKGELHYDIEQYIQTHHMNNVELCGYQTGGQLIQYIQESRALIIPSECAENAPMTILEAMACGKPVIGSKIGGIPEMLTHQNNNLLFTPAHAQELQKILLTFDQLTDDRVIELGKKNRQVIDTTYSLTEHYKSLCQVYEEVLCQQPSHKHS